MNDVILAVLSDERDDERVVLVHRREFGNHQILLRRESFSDDAIFGRDFARPGGAVEAGVGAPSGQQAPRPQRRVTAFGRPCRIGLWVNKNAADRSSRQSSSASLRELAGDGEVLS